MKSHRMQTLSGEMDNPGLVILDSYDTTIIGKLWTGSEWVDNPNPPTPIAPTTQDIMDKLNDMQGAQVSIASLDAAYAEGVNAV